MRIIYIHGFNSGPSTASGKKLRECFPEIPVDVLSYDCGLDCGEIYASLLEQAKKLPGLSLVAGGSLGGYYAARLASDLELPAVLVNPCNNPAKSLAAFVGENISFEDGKPWEFTPKALQSYAPLDASGLARRPRLVIIGRNDSLLDPLANEAFWRDHAEIVLTDDEHSIAGFGSFRQKILELAQGGS